MQIHENGAKADRDRSKIMAKYGELCSVCGLNQKATRELSRLTNQQFYRLCEDTYNDLPLVKKQKYQGYLKPEYRLKPAGFHWFRLQVLVINRAHGLGRIGWSALALWRWPRAGAWRKVQRAAAEKAIAAAEEVEPPVDEIAAKKAQG